MTHRAVGIYLLGSLGYALMGSSRQEGGGAVAIGGGGVQLQNTDGVILQLKGPKVGAEVSLAVAGVSIRLK